MSAQPNPPVQRTDRTHESRTGEGNRSNWFVLSLLLAWETLRIVGDSVRKVWRGEGGGAPRQTASGPVITARKTGRAEDRNLEPKRDSSTHQMWGTVFVVLASIAAVVAGVGFLFVYWTNANNFLLGITLALCFGAFGVALVLYSHWLMRAKEAVGPRETHRSDPGDRRAAAEEFYAEHEFYRRSLLKWIGVVSAGMITAVFISVIRSLGRPPGPSLFNTVWQRGQSLRTPEGTPVTVDALRPGNFMIVFPENSIGDEKAQTVLIRVNPADLQLPRERANWAPAGYVAYSRICTHAGCSVGMFEATTGQLMCPCHQSTFDVLKAAQPSGGPAARPLPQLPLYADADGTLRAAGGFSEPPGPGFWEMP